MRFYKIHGLHDLNKKACKNKILQALEQIN